jgi:predicted ATPase
MYFLRAESFYNVASEIERLDEEPAFGPPIIDSYGGTSLHEQSHGESFFAVFRDRFHGRGLYLLDEPEAALSPTRQLALLAMMRELIEAGAQFLIATHSPIIMGYPGATIFEVSESGLRRIEYRATEHYAVTKRFLTHPETVLSELFSNTEQQK